MAEYLTETITRSGFLNPGESLSIEFSVPNPGNIVAIASARWDRFFLPDPTKRLIEIYAPNISAPVAKRTDEGWFMTTVISHNEPSPASGTWRAVVTNREDGGEIFRLSVSYPGMIELSTLTVPSTVVDSIVNATISQISIHITDGTNASWIRFPASMGVPETRFTVPRYTKTISHWWHPDIHITEYVNDINSQTISSTLQNSRSGYPNGSMDLSVVFETTGREIRGTFDAQLGNLNLTVMLGLAVEDRRITYSTSNVGVSFPITINLVNIPDIIEDAVNGLIDYRSTIRNTVENAIRSLFVSSALRQAITNAINDQVAGLLGAGAQIVSVRVEGGGLTVKYYNT